MSGNPEKQTLEDVQNVNLIIGTGEKQRQRERSKRWRLKNPDKVRNIQKKWHLKNKDRAKKWKLANAEKVRGYRKKSKLRYRQTVKGKLCYAMNTRIWKYLKRGIKAGRRWEDLVGYTADRLKCHLEKQFILGMTWENHGPYWHIDHIIPVSAFNFEKPEDIDFKSCWALKNLRPLLAKENLSKWNKLTEHFQPSLTL